MFISSCATNGLPRIVNQQLKTQHKPQGLPPMFSELAPSRIMNKSSYFRSIANTLPTLPYKPYTDVIFC